MYMKHILISAIVFCVAAAHCSAQTTKTPPMPLRDATLYNGIEGTVRLDSDTDTWYFTADLPITDGRATIPAGTPVEMLPSSILEKIIHAAGDKQHIKGKLWARVTRYSNRSLLIHRMPSHQFAYRKAPDKHRLDAKFLSENLVNKNYLLAVYFMPQTEDAPPPAAAEPTKHDAPITAPFAESILPDDVFEQLNKRRVVDLKKMREMLETEGDVVLADRVGFVLINADEKIFAGDSLGRNVNDMQLILLPCESLELTEESIVGTPAVRQRFRVSGIVTTFQGRQYMLLQRAIRTWSHGNFSR